MSGGSIPANIAGLALGGTLFFIIAGFLVAYILNAKDIRDAFYKGVAVPALVISLANGVTAEKNKVHEVPAIPVNTGEINLPGQNESSFLTLWSPAAPAYAQIGGAGAAVNGTVEFEITPKDVKNISVSILDHDGNVIARTRSDNSAFIISFPAGEYTAVIETDEYYKEEQIRIAGNQTTKVAVVLEQKGFIKKFSGGVKSLLKR
jgi:hypothetical protein